MRTLFAALTIVLLILTAPPRAAEPNWHLIATVAESCSCTISCPCNFGGEPNRTPCEGNRLIAIKSGHYETTDLAGVSFLVTFNMRNWSKIYLSDKVTAAQEKAVEALLPIAFAGFHRGMLSFTKAPITMDITEKRVRFSGPEKRTRFSVMSMVIGALVNDSMPRWKPANAIGSSASTALPCCSLTLSLR